MPYGSSTLTNHDTDASLAPLAKRIRMAILRESKRAGVGHIGSALSVTEIIAALYGRVMRVTDPAHPDRDRFVLSKGHAALALYAALCERGWIDEAALATYCGDDTILGVHPDHALPGVDFSTGSLGQGLAFGAGAALAAKLSGSDRRVFVLVSDAECNEGSLWESVMFAAQHQLSNLVAIVDANGQQALDHTVRVLDLSPLDAAVGGVRLAHTCGRRPRSRPADCVRWPASRLPSLRSSSPARCSVRACRSWKAASSGTTCR